MLDNMRFFILCLSIAAIPLMATTSPERLLHASQNHRDLNMRVYFELDSQYLPDANFMLKQAEITPRMRRILLDWLSQVSEDFAYSHDTYHYAVTLIDRFLAKEPRVKKKKLQLVAIASLWLAAEVHTGTEKWIEKEDYVYMTENSYTVLQLNHAINQILKTLEWKVTQDISTASWVEYYFTHTLAEAPYSEYHFLKAMAILDACVEDVASTAFGRSELAAAAVLLITNDIEPLSDKDFEILTGFTKTDLGECIELVSAYYKPNQVLKAAPKSDLSCKHPENKQYRIHIHQPK